MSRRAFVVAGIVECLQPDRGGWELIDSHGAGTVVCPFTTGRGIGTETCEMDNVFPPDDLKFGLDTSDSLYECIFIYNCVFGSLISDVTCNYVCWLGKGWPVMACPSRTLVVLYWMLTIFACYVLNSMFGMLFLFSTTSLGCFCPRTLLFE